MDFSKFLNLLRRREPFTTIIHKCVLGQHVLELQMHSDEGWLCRDVDYELIAFIIDDFDTFYDDNLDPALDIHKPDPEFKPMWAGAWAKNREDDDDKE